MAKANGINKKVLAKKDMNFFAEFTANAAKAARMLGYGVAVGVLVVFVVLTVIIAFFIRNQIIKGQINDLKALLASPDYASLEQDAVLLTEKLNDMTNYYFALTQMRKNVDRIDPAPTDLPDVIAKCIPSDSFVTDYTVTSSQLNMSGYTFTYYSPVDMVNMLNTYDVFTARPEIKTDRVDAESLAALEDLIDGTTVEAINNYYKFTISGALVSTFHISVTRYAEGEGANATSLGGIETIDVVAGNSYAISGINTYTYAGTTYYLTKITVDGELVEGGSFSVAQSNDEFTAVARDNSDIKFYYSATQAAPEG
ncbi:MAG: hypothetical protein K5779_05780 [Saccharofermentans sp.]|nr:hypothetical protein [Saccharofermentans sp.]